MAKILIGKVVSTKMQNTAIVEVTRKVAHPLYKKLMKKSRKFKVATNGETLSIGQDVEIIETKKVAKDKYFKINRVLNENNRQKKEKKNDTA